MFKNDVFRVLFLVQNWSNFFFLLQSHTCKYIIDNWGNTKISSTYNFYVMIYLPNTIK